MANFFDQFDEPDKPASQPGNFFDQFDDSNSQSQPQISPAEIARQDNVVNKANGFDRFMFGVLNGLMDVGKGVGLFNDLTPEEQAAITSVQQKFAAKPSIAQDVGEFAGQAAPFLSGGGLISQVPKGAARLATAAGLGATEGGIVANGTGSDVATGATIGAVAGPVAELVGPAVGKVGNKISQNATDLYKSIAGLGKGSTDSTLAKASKAMDNAILGGDKAVRNFANEVMPDQQAVNAVKELGLESYTTPGMVSNNPAVRALDNAVATLPGTEINEGHKRFISELGKKADDLITSFGGDLDKQAVSERLAANFDHTVASLQSQADNIYDKVAQKIPIRDNIEANNALKYLENHADDLGGLDELSPILKRTMLRLDPNTLPTYGRLDNVRKQVGQAIGTKEGYYKDEETGVLKGLYAAITEDQQKIAEKYGAGELWGLGKELVKTRKGVEDNAQFVLGKKLQQSAIPKVERAIVSMAQGNGTDFSQLMRAIPQDMRKEVALTSLNKAFTSYAKSPGQQLGVDGFVKWYNGMQRNSSNLSSLHKAIGPEASKRLNSIYQAAKAMNRLNTGKQYASSLVDQQVKNFLKEDGGLAKLYGIAKIAKKAAVAEGVSSLSGLPGVGVASVISGVLSAGRKSRIKAADELLSSPEFKSMLFRSQSLPLDRIEARQAIERKIAQSKNFKKWEATLSDSELKNVSRTGIIAFLAGGDAD
ncbi:hypothetical protein LU631_03090 [Erwinia tracheiphila]|uniref:hypothetical protein n=1 Tax=Erwinia tracheiphila TaxID=65700 RepID=UPI00033E8471|nr:hypothetical protein [Erwinia tracheiphila]EOS95278.1 prophage protein [Erwinia tracheiphila PSU-1]UIA88429.1 hypothetical protein LU631_03090 [Erwinia tracheiphila]UIA96805.1 hypothetical protein LU633_01765 [Erwinia tracheiphila]